MKPKKLPEKPTIGIFSASGPISATVPVRYDRGVQYLRDHGYGVIHGNLRGKQDAYRSGSIAERAAEFNALLHDDKVDIIMSAIGGWVTNSILPYIDYEYLKSHPKVIIGYSDTTALHMAIYAKTGLTTFYGPAAAASFGELLPFVDWTFSYFDDMMKGRLCYPYAFPMPDYWTDEFISWAEQDRAKEQRPNDWLCVRPGRCRGRLMGGNLNTMSGFFGTEYFPEICRGDVLLIEDSLHDAPTIERSFSLLKLAGILDRVGGIILGKHELFDDKGCGRAPYEILLEVLGDRDIPILAEFDCCHTHPMLTMPLGLEVELDATAKTVTLPESPFE